MTARTLVARLNTLFLLAVSALGLLPTACSPNNPIRPRAEPHNATASTAASEPAPRQTPTQAAEKPSPVGEVAEAVISDDARKALDDEWEAAARLTKKGAVVERGPDQLHVTAVLFRGSAVRDADFADLRKMPRLKSLVVQVDSYHAVRPDQITNAAFAHVAELKGLERLEVPGLEIDDDACGAIGKLSNLKVLELADTRVSDDGLAHVKNLTRLTHLGLAGTRVTGDRLADLAPALTALRRLDLRGVPLTTADLAAVGRFVALEELYLPDAELPKGLHHAPAYYAYSPPASGHRGYKPVPAAKLNYAAGVRHLSGLVNLKSVAMTRLFRESPKDAGRDDAPLTTEYDSFANLLRGHTHPRTGAPWGPAQAFTEVFRVRVDAAGTLVCRRGDGFVPLADVRPDAVMVAGRPRGSVLQYLKGFRHVTSLDLSNLLVTDDDLRHLAGHRNLERLDLSGQYVTRAGLAHLKALPLTGC